jgi:hypothetical protein
MATPARLASLPMLSVDMGDLLCGKYEVWTRVQSQSGHVGKPQWIGNGDGNGAARRLAYITTRAAHAMHRRRARFGGIGSLAAA